MRIFLLSLFVSVVGSVGASAYAKDCTITSGDKQATFYKVATALTKVYNKYYHDCDFKVVESHDKTVGTGSLANFKFVAMGDATFGIVKQDSEYIKALNSDGFYDENSANTKTVIALHPEYFTVFIKGQKDEFRLKDLAHMKVALGSIGSGSRVYSLKFLELLDITPMQIKDFGASEAFEAFCAGELDAFLYFVGHPNVDIGRVLKDCDVHISPLDQDELRQLQQTEPSFKLGQIREKKWYGRGMDVKTLTNPTYLIAHKSVSADTIKRMRDICSNHKAELVEELPIFTQIECEF
jgi:uncharacterized protein